MFTDEKIFTVVTSKNPNESPTVSNCSNQEERRHDKTLAHMINVQTVTYGISRRTTSGRESLILVNHRVKVIEGCYRNVRDAVITVTARHASDLKRVRLSARQCPARMALEAINFLTDNFTRY